MRPLSHKTVFSLFWGGYGLFFSFLPFASHALTTMTTTTTFIIIIIPTHNYTQQCLELGRLRSEPYPGPT